MAAGKGEAPDNEGLLIARSALISSLTDEISDERVLRAMGRVARERFVAPDLFAEAYADRPLPIGHGQTTSQPRMIAIMLQELHLEGGERVLEIGTGSGYQTALLAYLAAEVVSVELIPELANAASAQLASLGIVNVRVYVATEALGWPALAPYDAIVVSAASSRIPKSLVDQLAPGGRLVIPVGSRESQDLMLAVQQPEGTVVTRKGSCRFVALIDPEANAYGNREDSKT